MTAVATSAPRLTLERVSSANLAAVEALTVHAQQRRFVASPSYYLAVCAYSGKGYRPLALVLEDEIVGFAIWRTEGTLGWICGFLIAQDKQGQGVGRAALAALIDFLAGRGCSAVKLSYDPDNHVAERLYDSHGFRPTGETLQGETVAMLDFARPPA